jgi:selenocysteine lyase/cysteine desulfurase
LNFIKKLGMLRLSHSEQRLTAYLMEQLGHNREVILYGSTPRVGVISFNLKGLPHALVGAVLCFEAGIGVRTGCFCAQGYVRQLLGEKENPGHLEYYQKKQLHKLPGMVRISLAAYNTKEEADILLQKLEQISKNKKAYSDRYHWSEQLGTYIPKNLAVGSLADHIFQQVSP